MASECPVCGAELKLPANIVPGELIECGDCGTDLEIESVDPVLIAEAPAEEEDWGE